MNEEKKIERIFYRPKKLLWWEGYREAGKLLATLRANGATQKIAIVGSLRRCKEIVGDINLLAATRNPHKLVELFSNLPQRAKIISKDDKGADILLKNGMRVNLKIVTKERFPFALRYLTGSEEHNVKLRKRAESLGFILGQYNSFNFSEKIEKEADIFKALKLSFIPPELREDRGEIEAAEKGDLPNLVKEEDLKGLFHIHTTASDGQESLEAIVQKAEKMGMDYIGISDHSRVNFYANGLSIERLLKQIEEIRDINESSKYNTHIFAGIECDILPNGELDYPDETLKKLDFCIAGIHFRLKQNAEEITGRLIKAIENPHVTMIAHMTGRLLLRREPYPLNAQKVIDAAIANNKIIEINSNPQRLDIDWRLLKGAKERGALFSLNPDAHSSDGLLFYKAGINVARKGWLEKGDLLNTRPLKEIKRYLGLV